MILQTEIVWPFPHDIQQQAICTSSQSQVEGDRESMEDIKNKVVKKVHSLCKN